MTRIRSAFTAISSRMKPGKDDISDAAAAGVGTSIISVVAFFTTDQNGWQFAFAFTGGIAAAVSAWLIIQPLMWAKIHRELRDFRSEALDMVQEAKSAGYQQALRDIEKMMSGGEKP